MGYHVLRLTSGAVRVGKYGVWVESDAVRGMSAIDRARFFKETCGLNPAPAQSLQNALKEAKDETAVLEALSAQAVGKRSEILRHRVAMGRLVLQPGEERRRTASHYTPRSLTEKVVKRTLEPLLVCLGPERTPEQILQLKICDPAMGSGAFLVATCRELASEIVAAWTRQGALAKIIEEHGDAHLHARRLVAQQCLYGVDKNAAAVELAKLSLWLVTLSKSLPFTFVDHALRHGDSLVGLDFKQIEAFHWAPEKQTETVRVLLREALDQAVDLRQQILALADREDAVSQGEKRRLFEFAQQAIDRVRVVADVCVGAFFAETKDAAREKERKRRLALVERWLGGDSNAGAEVEEMTLEARKKLRPFHWWIEFPEVFFDERPDPLQGGAVNGAALMESVVGNPPFLGGARISGELSPSYVDWLSAINHASDGRGDLSAHFFARALALLGKHGTAGLIATNSIAQGDTRETGLALVVGSGGVIYDATTTLYWPGEANVAVSLVHFALGRAASAPGLPLVLGGREVKVINSRLRPSAERLPAVALSANSGICFRGNMLSGAGFVLSAEERASFLSASSENAQVIFPYLGGEEVNSDPCQSFSRYVIDFGSRTLEEAQRWPRLLERVRTLVKPSRDAARGDTGTGAHGKKYWWQFVDRCVPMRSALASRRRCLVSSIVTKHLCFAWQPLDRVLANTLFVFAFDQTTQFACLQSRVHETWARMLSSSMRTDLRYTPSVCFETFAFPRPDPRVVIPAVESAGQALYEARAKVMTETQQGLTKTYNALKDPACTEPRILELRRLHEAMDRAVLDAYGWTDIAVPPYCPLSDAEKQALQAFEDEVIDRLYVLNAERAREEERLGLAGKKSKRARTDGAAASADEAAAPTPTTKPARAKKAKAANPAAGKDQGKLFE